MRGLSLCARAAALALPVGLLLSALAAPTRGDEDLVVEEGRQVAIEYTMTLEDGSVAETNLGREPLIFEVGGGQALPTIEAALTGLRVGDHRRIVVPPEEAYGEHRPELVREVPLEKIPDDHRTPGSVLTAESPEGESMQARVVAIEGDIVRVDFNRPLAGHTLTFDVEIVGIR